MVSFKKRDWEFLKLAQAIYAAKKRKTTLDGKRFFSYFPRYYHMSTLFPRSRKTSLPGGYMGRILRVYLTSGKESMKIMARMGEFVTRKGAYPPLADADKIQVVEMDELDMAAFAEKRKEYTKLFLQ